ncbi:hypothetical protein Dimus_034904 [Dionaea muscipula]
MGGHGGLNILPQKKWNVYNYENREKVRRDEEAAAKEEQLKQEQSRKRDAEFRLEQLRCARGLAPSSHGSAAGEPVGAATSSVEPEPQSDSDSKHINLFHGIKIFDPIVVARKEGDEEENRKRKKMRREVKAEAPRVVGPEEEKYKLGYGIAGKGVKAPWYVMKPNNREDDEEKEEEEEGGIDWGGSGRDGIRNRSGVKRKKTLEELREERLKREKLEKERERALLLAKGRSSGDRSRDMGHRSRGW